VSGRVLDGEVDVAPIPERRSEGMGEETPKKVAPAKTSGEIKIWRCKVCGYLCARPGPPETCPICKVGRERFEEFTFR
jgi:ferredoxin-thioredoxin reductase catalytic chain